MSTIATMTEPASPAPPNTPPAEPDPEALWQAKRDNRPLPCHLCQADPDCPACLGSGWIRPCNVCLERARAIDARAVSIEDGLDRERFCVVCGGRLYTAGSRPDPVADLDLARPRVHPTSTKRGQNYR